MSDTSITEELVSYVRGQLGAWSIDVVARVDNFIIMTGLPDSYIPGGVYLEIIHMHCNDPNKPKLGSLKVCDDKCLLCNTEVPKELVNLYSVMKL